MGGGGREVALGREHTHLAELRAEEAPALAAGALQAGYLIVKACGTLWDVVGASNFFCEGEELKVVTVEVRRGNGC